MFWLGHVVPMDDGRIPRDVLYGELAQGKRPTGRPYLRYKDVCKRDLKALDMSLETWQDTPKDCPVWRKTVHELVEALKAFEELDPRPTS